MNKPDNKPARRKLIHTYESLELQRNKAKSTVQDRLDIVGYRDNYADSISNLAW